MENPLHPFELYSLVHLSVFGVDISINKAVLMMWVVVALAAGLLIAAGSSRRLVPSKLQCDTTLPSETAPATDGSWESCITLKK